MSVVFGASVSALCKTVGLSTSQLALNLGMDKRFVVHTPLMWIDKADTWRMANDLGGDQLVELIIEETHTCYLGDRTNRHDWGYGCGSCPACDLRARGFERYREQSNRNSTFITEAAHV